MVGVGSTPGMYMRGGPITPARRLEDEVQGLAPGSSFRRLADDASATSSGMPAFSPWSSYMQTPGSGPISSLVGMTPLPTGSPSSLMKLGITPSNIAAVAAPSPLHGLADIALGSPNSESEKKRTAPGATPVPNKGGNDDDDARMMMAAAMCMSSSRKPQQGAAAAPAAPAALEDSRRARRKLC